jgi:HK97 gp10 family phage protein
VSGVVWHGGEENGRINRTIRAKLNRAAIVVNRRAKRLLSVAGTGQLRHSNRDEQGRFLKGFKAAGRINVEDLHWSKVREMVAKDQIMKHKGTGAKRIYGAFPSAPGEPPHKQTGRLRSSVTYEVLDGELIARVGTNVKYAKWLELGTKNMAPRPWLRRALNESGDEIDRIMGA